MQVKPKTLTPYLENFRAYGSKPAFVQHRGYRIERWTYRRVAEEACRLARELQKRGVSHGDSVLLWGEDSAEWVAAFWGCILRGAVAVPMDKICAPEFACRIAREAEARLVICSRAFAGKVEAPTMLLEDLPEAISGHSAEPYSSHAISPEDIVEIVFTSGTTADPKGIVISHRNLLANLQPLEGEIRRYLKYEWPVHPLRFLNLVPLSHVFGQFLAILVPQVMRAVVVFQDSLNPSEIIRTIRRERVSILIAVPRIIQSLKDKIERDLRTKGNLRRYSENFSKAAGEHFLLRWWRFRRIHSEFGWKFWALISGGAALDPQTEEFWRRLSFVVVQGYGLTETSSVVTVNHPMKPGRGSIGKALPGSEIRLADNGEILVRSANVAGSFLQGKHFVPIQEHENWYHTGDLGEIDAEGNLFFKGRMKHVIVTPEGMNVYPEDLEAALRRQPGVKECVVVGIRRNGNAEPCAALLLADSRISTAEIVSRANAELAGFQQIRRWLLWPDEDFPRTATLKPRTSIIQKYAEAHVDEAGSPPRQGKGLGELIGRVTGRRVMDLSSNVSLERDLQLSSMERVELLGCLEERYQVELDESKFTAATTIGDLELMIRTPAPLDVSVAYPRWAQNPVLKVLRSLFYYLLPWPLTHLLAHPEVRGRENLEKCVGPLLLVSNHVTQIDIVFVLAVLPPKYRHSLAVAMSGELLESMRNPPPGTGIGKRMREQLAYWLVTAVFNVFPLMQQSGFRRSFAFAGESVDRGYSILVFPEGGRTKDGAMAPFRNGIGILAERLGLPVVPLRLDGLYRLKSEKRKIAGPGKVSVRIGEPVRFAPGTPAEEIASNLRALVSNL